MEKIIDLHTHLETLGPLISLRSKWQHHLHSIEGHLLTGNKYILSVAMYVPLLSKYNELVKMTEKFKKSLEKFEDVKLITKKDDLKADFQIGILLHIESARAITEHKTQLPELYEMGVRGIIPMHFVDNKLGNSADDLGRRLHIKRKDKGLTGYGRDFVEHCNKLGMWLDLSHASNQTSEDIISIANHVMISHVGIRDLVARQRNQPIKIMKKVADKGGVIGLIPWAHLIGDELGAYVEQIKFALAQELNNSLCIGSDFGAPIKTHKLNNSITSLARSINTLQIDKSGIKWNNAYKFFESVL